MCCPYSTHTYSYTLPHHQYTQTVAKHFSTPHRQKRGVAKGFPGDMLRTIGRYMFYTQTHSYIGGISHRTHISRRHIALSLFRLSISREHWFSLRGYIQEAYTDTLVSWHWTMTVFQHSFYAVRIMFVLLVEILNWWTTSAQGVNKMRVFLQIFTFFIIIKLQKIFRK